ncbi:MAG: hypothetical protein U1U88_002315 [Lawsonella clevelandensis]
MARWEINYHFDTLLQDADDVQLFECVVENTAWENGLTATFMPKPLFGDNGSGMHDHMSLFGRKVVSFSTTKKRDGYGGLSDLDRYFIGERPQHTAAVLAFEPTPPSTLTSVW